MKKQQAEHVTFTIHNSDGNRKEVPEGILLEFGEKETVLYTGTSREDGWFLAAKTLLDWIEDYGLIKEFWEYWKGCN